MKKVLCLIPVLLLLAGTVALGIEGWPMVTENLNVALGAVTRITATTYQPRGAMTNVLPVLIQTNGTGYFRLDPFTSTGDANYTPTISDYHCASGDIIEVERPEYFRITPAAAAFSAPCTSFAK